MHREIAGAGLRGVLRRLHGGRELRRQVDADDLVGPVGLQRTERVDERARRRCRGLGQLGRRREFAVELGRRKLLAVDELLGAEADGERDDLDAEGGDFGVGEITGAVGDDANGHLAGTPR